MEQLRSAVLAVCLLSSAVGLMTLIRPGKLLERQVRFLVSLLLVTGMTVPFLHMDIPEICCDMQAAEERSCLVADELTEQMTDRIQQLAGEAVRELLADSGISCTEISTEVHIDDAGRIYLSKVNVQCDDFSGASQVLAAALGEEVSIHVSETLSEDQEE